MQRIIIKDEELFETYEEQLADCEELIPITHYDSRVIICIDNDVIKGVYMEDDIKKQIIYSHRTYRFYKEPRNLDEIQWK